MKVESKKILFVDDSKEILDILSRLLARLDCQAVSADNGERGLALFLQAPYDIVLTDYDMPGMDGLTLAHHIKAKSPETMVVLMTGHDRAEFREQIESGTLDLVLCKPFDLLEIMYILQPQQGQREENRPAGPRPPAASQYT